MKRLLLFVILCAGASTPAQQPQRRRPPARTQSAERVEERSRDFDAGWRFFRGDAAGAERAGFDDSRWRALDLPHDWSIEDLPEQAGAVGPFTKESPGATSTGYVLGGTGWYRKHFTLGAGVGGKAVRIVFDGVYMESDVWLNGQHLGTHPYGYTPFYYDLTPYLEAPGRENVIAVRVRNVGKNSRWYSGSGIYRGVRLVVTDPVHVVQWGVYVTTPEVARDAATVSLKISVVNAGDVARVTLRTRLLSPAGQLAGAAETPADVPAGGDSTADQSIRIANPALWSPDAPNLYRAEVSVIKGGRVVDETSVNFGVRTIRFDAATGFTLNGQKLLLRGGCLHHDNGPLGSAAIDRAEERRVELLKANGFNAVRTSHNPPSQQFLDACDRLGLLVIDEAFDMWERPKNPDDYHRFFDEWWQRDLDSMLLRDRDHPSVVLWSIGNEINERADPPGLRLAKQLIAEAHRLDPTRAVTEAICHFWDHPGRPWEDNEPALALLDVAGYNYQWKLYEPDHAKQPARIMVGTESTAMEAFDNWRQVESHPWVVGDFVWTAMDYMGETGIGHTWLEGDKDSFLKDWPWYVSYCGDLDLTGFKKPQSFYRDVVWRRSPVELEVHAPVPAGRTERVSYWGWPDLRQSWTWPGEEGKPLRVVVYTRAPAVRLELNGRVVGEKSVADDAKLTATFEVPYEPGELKVVALDGGRASASKTLVTAGPPLSLRLTADRQRIRAARDDLSYVAVEIVDARGRLVPNQDRAVGFSVRGEGELAAVGDANPAGMASFRAPRRNTFRGRCLAILRPAGRPGKIVLRAQAEGLRPAELVVQTY
jgi:beta-galactosidase